MDLTQQDIQVLLEIISKSSIQIEQYESVVRPIVNKLQVLGAKLNVSDKAVEQPVQTEPETVTE